MINYTIRNIDESLWHRIKIMSVVRKVSIKEIVMDHLHKELKAWEKKVGDPGQFKWE